LLEFSKFETEARNEIKSKVRHLEEMATKLEETDVRCKVKVQSLVERIDDLQEDSQFFEHIIANIKDSVANLTCASC
jgi:predicted nuclease with TOPRIM domain